MGITFGDSGLRILRGGHQGGGMKQQRERSGNTWEENGMEVWTPEGWEVGGGG